MSIVAALALVPVVAFALAPNAPGAVQIDSAAEPVLGRLHWSASETAVRYSISVATDPSGPFRHVADTEKTEYDFVDGLGGVAYYFRIAALNGAGESSQPAAAGPFKAIVGELSPSSCHLGDEQVRQLPCPSPGAGIAADAHRAVN